MSEDTFIIDNHEYSISQSPLPGDVLVLKKKQAILGSLRLDTVTQNLELCVDMYRLAYIGATAANAGPTKARVVGLQSEFGKICVQANEAMGTLKDASQLTLELLLGAYRYLVTGKDKVALAKLARCSEQAKRMAAAAAKLSQEFLALQSKSAEAKSEAVLAHASEEEKRRTADAEMARFTEEVNGFNASMSNLIEELDALNETQRKAEKQLAEDNKKGFIMGIISVVANVAATGLQTYAKMSNPLSVLVAQNSAGQLDNAELKAATEKWEAAEKQRLASEQTLRELNRQVGTLKKTIADCELEIQQLNAKQSAEGVDKAAPDNAQRIADKQTILNDQTAKLQALEGQIEDQKVTLAQHTKTCAALGDSARTLATGCDNMAKQAFSAADKSQAVLDKAMDNQRKVRQERNELQLKMGGVLGQLAATKLVSNNAEVAVKALQVSMFAISQVIIALNDASLFWTQMAGACEALDQRGLDRDVIDMDLLQPEERIQEYKTDPFRYAYLQHICSWVALNDIASEYLVYVESSRTQNNHNISHSIDDPQQAAQLVSSLAQSINEKMDKYASQAIKAVA
ncbi:hypothetical protein CCOS865_00920 [Pseudomonas reidholzensis]|uniref:Uncharacterized protein n=1 Tax=Pseudomonas reidholzensis TaxID=1785162 RepID=A0A383RQG5_9PSED|nr:hypothetical protein [Pseudomonas reidholzensis]SYX88681.1 hypothetical protein CCOS865_00920 [Pseudomonas reidholzensis]